MSAKCRHGLPAETCKDPDGSKARGHAPGNDVLALRSRLASLEKELEEAKRDRAELQAAQFRALTKEQIESCLRLGQAEVAANKEYATNRYPPDKGGPALARLNEVRKQHRALFPEAVDWQDRATKAEARAEEAVEALANSRAFGQVLAKGADTAEAALTQTREELKAALAAVAELRAALEKAGCVDRNQAIEKGGPASQMSCAVETPSDLCVSCSALASAALGALGQNWLPPEAREAAEAMKVALEECCRSYNADDMKPAAAALQRWREVSGK